MTFSVGWPSPTEIGTGRLTLEPLRADHADEAAPLFDDDRLHEFIGGEPATVEQLRARYRRQAAGLSPDGSQGWLNWMVRERRTGVLVGTVQATLSRAGENVPEADLAWVIGVPFQGRGYAAEAVVTWLSDRHVRNVKAYIHPGHDASAGVARRLGMGRTGEVVDGELCWARSAAGGS